MASEGDGRLMDVVRAVLEALPRRCRDILEHVHRGGGGAETIAVLNMVSTERAAAWIADAEARFVQELGIALKRAEMSGPPTRALDAAGGLPAVIRRALEPDEDRVADDAAGPDPRDRLGTSLGSYRLVEVLGAGGMGVVYAAEHAQLGRAAVKVLSPVLGTDPRAIDRFVREARAARRIEHPGVVTIYDVGQEGPTPYIAMELLRGQTVGARLAAGPVPAADSLRIARQTASALVAAHRAGIAHRDLKPDNVFLVADPDVAGGQRIKLLDFGIAKLFDRDRVPDDEPFLTRRGDIMGSPAYMAPEQCVRSRDAGAPADVYALGCTLFHLLAGRPPYVRPDLLVLAAHVHDPVPSVREVAPEVPAAVDRLLGRMLAKAPGERPDMEEVHRALAELEGEAAGAPERPVAAGAEPAEEVPGPDRRERWRGLLAPTVKRPSSRSAGRGARWGALGTLIAVAAAAVLYVVFAHDPGTGPVPDLDASSGQGMPQADPPEPAPAIDAGPAGSGSAGGSTTTAGGSTTTAGGEPGPADGGPGPASPPPPVDLATLRGQHPAAARAWRRARAARKDWLTRQAALKLPAGLERDADRALAAGDRHLRGGDAKAAERSYRSAETLLDQLQAGAQAGSAARDGADTAAKSYRSAPGPAHGDPDAATSLMSAAAADWQQGHVDKAADEYTRAAATYRTATTDLAEAQREWHAYSIALGAYWQEKREDWNLHAGSEQFDAGDAMHYKARGLLKDGKPAEAAAAFAEAARLVQDATERHRRARGQ